MHSQPMRVLVIAAALGTFAGCASMREPFAPRVSMETCVQAALAQKPGRVIEVDGETERGAPVFEVDIAGTDDRRWEVKCDGTTGKVLKVAEEWGEAKAAASAGHAPISEAQARKAALAARPGEVLEVEYEVESNGRVVYEFDIRAADGAVWEVEVDAATGDVLGTQRERFLIGRD